MIRQRLSRAFTFLEVVTAMAVISIALLVLYTLFVSSSRTVASSHYQYMALLVAREVIDELRQQPVSSWVSTRDGEWKDLGGRGLFQTVVAQRVGESAAANHAANPASVKYPAEYKRIQYRIDVAQVVPPHPRMRKVTIIARWQEHGGKDEKSRPNLTTFSTILINHSTDPEGPAS